MPIVTWAGPVL